MVGRQRAGRHDLGRQRELIGHRGVELTSAPAGHGDEHAGEGGQDHGEGGAVTGGGPGHQGAGQRVDLGAGAPEPGDQLGRVTAGQQIVTGPVGLDAGPRAGALQAGDLQIERDQGRRVEELHGHDRAPSPSRVPSR